MKARALARWVAYIGGWFWLPCPLCGAEFGGQEWRDQVATDGTRLVSSVPCPDGPLGMSLGICPDCTAAGRGYVDPVVMAWLDWEAEGFWTSHPELVRPDGEER